MNQQVSNSPIELGQKSILAMGGFLPQVYGWMTLALLITAVVAGLVGANNQLLYWLALNQSAFTILFVVELVVVIGLSALAHKLNVFVAGLLFIFYAMLNGVVLGVIFMIYTESSIFSTFLVTAGTFAAMSIYGMVTNADLSKFRSIALMSLFGLLIGLLINIFLQSDPLSWVLTFLGLGIFIVLTAYDTQKIKQMGENYTGSMSGLAVRGALILYLDFINIFIRLLQIFGKRK